MTEFAEGSRFGYAEVGKGGGVEREGEGMGRGMREKEEWVNGQGQVRLPSTYLRTAHPFLG